MFICYSPLSRKSNGNNWFLPIGWSANSEKLLNRFAFINSFDGVAERANAQLVQLVNKFVDKIKKRICIAFWVCIRSFFYILHFLYIGSVLERMTSIHFILCNKTDFFYFQHSLCSNSNFWLDCNCTASFLSQLCIFSSNEMERAREKEKESNIKLQGWHVSSKNEKSFDMLLICIHWHTHTQNVYITNAVHPFGFQHKSVSVEVFAFFILAFKNGL